MKAAQAQVEAVQAQVEADLFQVDLDLVLTVTIHVSVLMGTLAIDVKQVCIPGSKNLNNCSRGQYMY